MVRPKIWDTKSSKKNNKTVCRYFARGHCDKGKKCRFQHNEPDSPERCSRVVERIDRSAPAHAPYEDALDSFSEQLDAFERWLQAHLEGGKGWAFVAQIKPEYNDYHRVALDVLMAQCGVAKVTELLRLCDECFELRRASGTWRVHLRSMDHPDWGEHGHPLPHRAHRAAMNAGEVEDLREKLTRSSGQSSNIINRLSEDMRSRLSTRKDQSRAPVEKPLFTRNDVNVLVEKARAEEEERAVANAHNREGSDEEEEYLSEGRYRDEAREYPNRARRLGGGYPEGEGGYQERLGRGYPEGEGGYQERLGGGYHDRGGHSHGGRGGYNEHGYLDVRGEGYGSNGRGQSYREGRMPLGNTSGNGYHGGGSPGIRGGGHGEGGYQDGRWNEDGEGVGYADVRWEGYREQYSRGTGEAHPREEGYGEGEHYPDGQRIGGGGRYWEVDGGRYQEAVEGGERFHRGRERRPAGVRSPSVTGTGSQSMSQESSSSGDAGDPHKKPRAAHTRKGGRSRLREQRATIERARDKSARSPSPTVHARRRSHPPSSPPAPSADGGYDGDVSMRAEADGGSMSDGTKAPVAAEEWPKRSFIPQPPRSRRARCSNPTHARPAPEAWRAPPADGRALPAVMPMGPPSPRPALAEWRPHQPAPSDRDEWRSGGRPSTAAPSWGPPVRASEVPRAREVPRASKVPRAREVPRASKVPRAREAPRDEWRRAPPVPRARTAAPRARTAMPSDVPRFVARGHVFEAPETRDRGGTERGGGGGGGGYDRFRGRSRSRERDADEHTPRPLQDFHRGRRSPHRGERRSPPERGLDRGWRRPLDRGWRRSLDRGRRSPENREEWSPDRGEDRGGWTDLDRGERARHRDAGRLRSRSRSRERQNDNYVHRDGSRNSFDERAQRRATAPPPRTRITASNIPRRSYW